MLMVVFLVATIIIVTSALAPSVLINGRRDREAEVIWRGEQYQRAIGLYYTKMGRYPTKIEDLTRQTNGVRFLRQAYTDPNNKEDGSWRYIYVAPNGQQLIGSLLRTTVMDPVPTAQSVAIKKAAAQQAGASSANPLESQPQALTGDVIGGNIIGVAGKVKEPSLRFYNGGDQYNLWEFIWTPSAGMLPNAPAAPLQQTPGAPLTGVGGQQPTGSGPNQMGGVGSVGGTTPTR
jgi:hypothetical protein